MPGMSPSTAATVDEAANLIRDRIKELDAERTQLERALASLTGGREGRRGPGRPRGSAPKAPSTGRRRRRRRGGTPAPQGLKPIAESPGVTASPISPQMKIKPKY